MSTLRLAVLGDSIAWGQGADRKRERLAPRLVHGLARHGVEVEAEVFAAKGARSSALAGQVAVGRRGLRTWPSW